MSCICGQRGKEKVCAILGECIYNHDLIQTIDPAHANLLIKNMHGVSGMVKLLHAISPLKSYKMKNVSVDQLLATIPERKHIRHNQKFDKNGINYVPCRITPAYNFEEKYNSSPEPNFHYGME